MGRSRGGLTTKVHALVDGRGLPLQLTLTPGLAGDCPEAAQLLGRLRPGTIVLADKAYDADWLCRAIEAQGAAPKFPSMRHRRWKACFSRTPVPGTQSDRTLLQPHQAFQARRHALRKARRNYLAMLKLAAKSLDPRLVYGLAR